MKALKSTPPKRGRCLEGEAPQLSHKMNGATVCPGGWLGQGFGRKVPKLSRDEVGHDVRGTSCSSHRRKQSPAGIGSNTS